MESNNQHTFEQEWQKAFKNASTPPPEHLWENIERELDKKDSKRPFLFYLHPSYMGAGIAAALFIALGGILYFYNQEHFRTELAQNNIIKKNNQPSNEVNNQIKTNSSKKTVTDNSIIFEENKQKNNQNTKSNIDNALVIPAITSFKNHSPDANAIKGQPIADTFNKTEIAQIENAIESQPIADTFNKTEVSKSLPSDISEVALLNLKNELASLRAIESIAYQPLGNRFILTRPMLLYDYNSPISDDNKTESLASNDSKFWIGLESGRGAFNPNMKLNELNTIAIKQADDYASNRSIDNDNIAGLNPNYPTISQIQTNQIIVTKPLNAIQSGIASNVSVLFGYKIHKKFSLESGIRYLKGNTTLVSNTFAIGESNNYTNLFFIDYLAQINSKDSDKSNAFVADISQVNNRYEYLLIPLQVGYGLSISKKTRLDILGGFSADIFVNNIIESDNTNFVKEATFNNQSNTYKPLNISGLGSLRFNYLFDKHWQINLGASAQKALVSGINNNTNLYMKMQVWGINYGLSYRF
jgi:hypothetical protein